MCSHADDDDDDDDDEWETDSDDEGMPGGDQGVACLHLAITAWARGGVLSFLEAVITDCLQMVHAARIVLCKPAVHEGVGSVAGRHAMHIRGPSCCTRQYGMWRWHVGAGGRSAGASQQRHGGHGRGPPPGFRGGMGGFPFGAAPPGYGDGYYSERAER